MVDCFLGDFCLRLMKLLKSHVPLLESKVSLYPIEDNVPMLGISHPLSKIPKELSKEVPDSVIRDRTEAIDFYIKCIPPPFDEWNFELACSSCFERWRNN